MTRIVSSDLEQLSPFGDDTQSLQRQVLINGANEFRMGIDPFSKSPRRDDGLIYKSGLSYYFFDQKIDLSDCPVKHS